MKSLVKGLCSVALMVDDLEASRDFYRDVWRLDIARDDGKSVYLRGTGPAPYILALHRGDRTAVASIDLAADQAGIEAIGERLGGAAESLGRLDSPGGGTGIAFEDPEGRTVRVFADDAKQADASAPRDRPHVLSHVVLNSPQVEDTAKFYCDTLGFMVIDRTKAMTFLRCNDYHHVIALAHGPAATLNHIAFEMPTLDCVMRGAARVRDAGYPIEWGVGRHGPGANVFTYFVAPGGVVVEYTAEVEIVGDDYKVGTPDDWTWPPNRADRWGVAIGPTDRLRVAQQQVGFARGLSLPAG